MAGWFASLHFRSRPTVEGPDVWPASLLECIRAFARHRSRERAVRRNGWKPAYGGDPGEWQAYGLEPSELGLSSCDETIDVVEPDVEPSLDRAIRLWRASAWSGIRIDYDVPPGEAGFPDMFGACRWYVWWFRDRWHTSASIEYPTSSVGRDPRWDAWFEAFASAAARELGLERRAADQSFDPFTVE